MRVFYALHLHTTYYCYLFSAADVAAGGYLARSACHFCASWGLSVAPVGRATARLLNMNDSRRVELRLRWLEEGRTLD